jgi:hypothetical protein
LHRRRQPPLSESVDIPKRVHQRLDGEWGELRTTVDNPSAAIQFEPGKEYYLDFTAA